ncbi:MAG: aminotransferase class I/II-fold pyridoxal phosphate-dependent enzyme [Acidimicrobiia bacterium]
MRDVSAYETPTYDAQIDLDLSRNEGTSPAEELIASLDDPARLIQRYPDTGTLREQIADLHGLEPGRVLVTAGGDDALFRCFLAFTREDGEVLSTYPTFEMISRYAEQRGTRLSQAQWWDDGFPLEELSSLVTDDTDAIFVVSPNNPTGQVATADDLIQLAARVPLLVLDAAYTEFADIDLTPVALELKNAVVVRTLSKAYGLAGLRVGYLLGPASLVSAISAYGSPYSVSALSAGIASARLRRPRAELTDIVHEVRRERSDLISSLGGLGFEVKGSQANFVLATAPSAPWVADAAASLGVALRTFPGREGLEQSIRITLPGQRARFDRLIRTLEVAMAPQALLFDLDGVLADVSKSQTRAIVETALDFGVEVTPEHVAVMKAAGHANDDWVLTHRLITDQGVDVGLDEVTASYETRYQGKSGHPGLKAEESLLVEPARWRRWESSFPLAVVTGRPRSDAEELLDRFGLLATLGALVTREDGPLKPEPAPISKALSLLGVSRAWMVGDTIDDVASARRAGVVPIGVIAPGDDPIKTRETLKDAARVLEDVNELEELLP